MLNLRRHHKIGIVLVGAFVLAWALWTFVWLPMSETPSQPDPSAEVPLTPVTPPQ